MDILKSIIEDNLENIDLMDCCEDKLYNIIKYILKDYNLKLYIRVICRSDGKYRIILATQGKSYSLDTVAWEKKEEFIQEIYELIKRFE